LGRQETSAATPTLGSLVVHAFPEAKTGLTVALIGVVAILVVYLLVRRPPTLVAGAASRAAIVFAVGFVFAPAARFGYIVYPIELLVWASLMARTGSTAPSVVSLDP
jgi:phosphatidylinositol alpha-1,6-mannosyltransferase